MIRRALISLLFVSTACAAAPPPRSLQLDPFYTQYLSADGIPIIASSKPPEKALKAARSMAKGMLDHRPDLARFLVRQHYTIALIAQGEALLDLPENRDWVKPPPDDPRLTRCEKKHYEERIGRLTAREYWDERARGIGGQHILRFAVKNRAAFVLFNLIKGHRRGFGDDAEKVINRRRRLHVEVLAAIAIGHAHAPGDFPKSKRVIDHLRSHRRIDRRRRVAREGVRVDQ